MMERLPGWVRQHLAALRALLVLTVLLGIAYPLVITAVAQIPGLQAHADGSLVHHDGQVVGSSIIGQSFTDAKGNPIPRYFQPRPSAAGDGYDPTATSASNLGPEQIIDTLPNPKMKGDTGTPGLLTLVCQRSRAVGLVNGVDGRRPYCTANGIGAVLSVIHEHGLTGPVRRVVSVNQECPARPFVSMCRGVPVHCANFGVDYRIGRIVLVRGPGKPWPSNPVPPDAVTASGSGLDPDISVAYAQLQAARVARANAVPEARILGMVHRSTSGRELGFMGEPTVNVLKLNMALDQLSHRQ